MDYTIKQYVDLIKSFKNNNLTIYGIQRWIEKNPVKGILLRHDVDRWAWKALQIADIENKYQIKSSYYFRMNFLSSKKKKLLKRSSNWVMK